MKKIYLKIPVLVFAALTWSAASVSCGQSDGHKEETESHEGHDHDHEGHDHDHEDHDHKDHDEDHDHDGDSHEGHDHSALIELKKEQADRFGVVTERIDPSSFSEVTVVSGRIESKASDEGVATATRNGILTLSPNVNVGVRVGAGASIGSISASNVQGGDPTVQAVTARNAAKRELDRLKPLHDDGIVSTEEYNNALRAYEEAEAAVKTSRQGSASVASPKGGVITQLLARSGEYVEIGQRIAVVSGNTTLTLRADVPEKYIGRLAGVTTANFRPASSEETLSIEELGGKMISNSGSSVSENGYIPVYFSFSNNGSVAPGAFAEVFLKSGERHDVLSVPKEAVVEINGNKCVYAAHGDGHFIKHVVTLGASDGKRVEVLSGLHPGEDVVVKGAQVVRMAETSATAVPGHTHNH
ncbi:MAG: efflux RND transporter periplasmic adaptor subunit [Muribaculaceae bacterium]|nr:efflux RND transporter periplasmic adaptor subunit [Muribaculaceae bacterium]